MQRGGFRRVRRWIKGAGPAGLQQHPSEGRKQEIGCHRLERQSADWTQLGRLKPLAEAMRHELVAAPAEGTKSPSPGIPASFLEIAQGLGDVAWRGIVGPGYRLRPEQPLLDVQIAQRPETPFDPSEGASAHPLREVE
ncbi:MAG TPA: hypothetical protein VH879_08085 [Gemmatimonadales bacterium]